MYKIKFENENREVIISVIRHKKDLAKIMVGEAKNSMIECQVGNTMSAQLHRAIINHNTKVKDNNNE